jgi:hypothetical protein
MQWKMLVVGGVSGRRKTFVERRDAVTQQNFNCGELFR